MKNNVFLNLLLLLPSMGILAQQQVTSEIEKVTVFSSGAQVIRKTNLSIPLGKTELIFAGISPKIDKQSIQVRGEGAFTILSVVHQTNYLNEQTRRVETTVLENRKNNLQQSLDVEKAMLGVYQNERDLLSKNQAVGGSNTGLKLEDLKNVIDFQRARLSEVLLKELELQQKIHLLDSTIQNIHKQLQALNQRKDFATSEILVSVLSQTNTNGNFEVSYFVKDAGWFATYDLRVDEINQPIDLAFKANIFQSSGEDWNNVKLSISNGDPTESGVAPKLNPWYLRFGYSTRNSVAGLLQGRTPGLVADGGRVVTGRITDANGEPLIGASVLIQGSSAGTITDIDGVYSINIPEDAQNFVVSYTGYDTKEIPISGNRMDVALNEGVQLDEVVVTAYGISAGGRDRVKKEKSSQPLSIQEENKPTSVSFDIEIPYTIPNDGKVYVVEIKEESVPAIYAYYAAPKIEEAAYLTTKIIDWQDLNLLDGEVNLFFEGAYLGKSLLDISNAGDTLSISLGKDKGISVQRKRLKEYTSKQFLSNAKTETRAYEITVRNNKQQTIDIVVHDQFPISTNKEISVDEQEYKDADLNKETKILTWKYQLPAKQEKKHLMKFSVKYPKNQILELE